MAKGHVGALQGSIGRNHCFSGVGEMKASWNHPNAWQWFALKIAPGRELITMKILEDDGFDVAVPLVHKRTSRGYLALPRLRGYVFIGFCERRIPWLAVMRFSMILGVVCRMGEPVALPAMQVFKLASRAQRPLRVATIRGRRRRRGRPTDAMILNGRYQGYVVREIRCIEADRESEREIAGLLSPVYDDLPSCTPADVPHDPRAAPLAPGVSLPYNPVPDERAERLTRLCVPGASRLDNPLADDRHLCPDVAA